METLERHFDIIGTQKNYKKVAWFYNSWSKLTESKAARKVIELSAVQNGESVLELACGTGLVFKELVSKNPNGINLGIDLSKDMLAKAERLMRKENQENYSLQQGNVLKLNIPNNSFDKLINNFMLDLMPENKFDIILSEFNRILKPNGTAVISIFSPGVKKINKIWVWTAKYFPKLLTNCRPIEIKSNLINAGFEILTEIDISQNSFPSKVYQVKTRSAEIKNTVKYTHPDI